MPITQERLGEFVKTALQVLAENDDHLPSRDVIRCVEQHLQLTDYERETLPKGIARWENALKWYTVDAVKAGWLIKRNGVWYLTEEGKKAIKLDSLTFFKTARQKYREALIARQGSESTITIHVDDLEESLEKEAATPRSTVIAVDNARSIARAEFEKHIGALDPYEFQNLIAALLRGMGYYTPFVAPRGKDGGIDILAYRDPLGSVAPRLKVQVKHRKQKAAVNAVRELIGLLAKEGDVGLIVSSGGFTSEAEAAIRSSSKHIEKIDLTDLIEMWDDHYDKMEEEDRRLMPLKRIAFLAPEEPT